jgi:hypothetical protein
MRLEYEHAKAKPPMADPVNRVLDQFRTVGPRAG